MRLCVHPKDMGNHHLNYFGPWPSDSYVSTVFTNIFESFDKFTARDICQSVQSRENNSRTRKGLNLTHPREMNGSARRPATEEQCWKGARNTRTTIATQSFCPPQLIPLYLTLRSTAFVSPSISPTTLEAHEAKNWSLSRVGSAQG